MQFFCDIPSNFDTVPVILASCGGKPALRNIGECVHIDLKNRIVHFAKNLFARISIDDKPSKGGVRSCRNELGKQGRMRFCRAATLIGKPGEPEDEDSGFEIVPILDASTLL